MTKDQFAPGGSVCIGTATDGRITKIVISSYGGMKKGQTKDIALAQKYLRYRAVVTMYDNYHFQYEQGFLQEDSWRAFRVRMKSWLSDALTAEMYRQQDDHYRQSFRNLCDNLLIEIPEKAK